MQLIPEKSLCKKNPPSVVSKDKGESRKHYAINPERKFDLRHYQLDGVLVSQERCCDFLLINDSMKKAYFIELKGKNVDDAVDQLKSAEQRYKSELAGYTCFYRIVCSKARTHKIRSTKVLRFSEKCKGRLIIKEKYLEETLK